MSRIRAERGYLIPAVDTESVDYLTCAIRLAESIRCWHPDANISVLTVKPCDHPVFNHVIPLPHGDLGGYANDWQVFGASPYRQTIKLEADMLATSPVDHWWTLFEHRDVVISQGARDWLDQAVTSRHYRKTFDINHLPDVYNAITYWRLSPGAQEFFHLVRTIFENWDQWRTLLKFADEAPTTDVVYAMAATVMGHDRVTLPPGLGPTIVHMKRHAIGGQTEDWTQELIWERQIGELSIQTRRQWGFFHYHVKDWS